MVGKVIPGKCGVCGKPITGDKIFLCEDCERENVKQVLKDVAKRCQDTQACHNCDLCGDDGKSCLIDGHPWEWEITLEEDK